MCGCVCVCLFVCVHAHTSAKRGKKLKRRVRERFNAFPLLPAGQETCGEAEERKGEVTSSKGWFGSRGESDWSTD